MKFKFLLIGIIILTAITRLWMLDKYPNGLNADEAAIGYNAYSLIQTQKDEYGSFLPLTFKSFGDYKPGLYFYFVAPFVKVLGLSAWAVRLPSAFLGIGTVIVVYFLARRLFNSRRVGLFASLLLAINPWHIHFSRGGWETNAATFFITLAIWLFLKSKEKLVFLFYSCLSLLISMYLYQSPRLVVPILVTVTVFLYHKQLLHSLGGGASINRPKKKLKMILLGLFVLILISVPLLTQFMSGTGAARFTGLSFLSDLGPKSRLEQLRGEHQDPKSFLAVAIHNKITAYMPVFLGHYLDHFSPSFLFINGELIPRNKIPETGQFFLICALLLPLGILVTLKTSFSDSKLLYAWVFTAPLASAMTYQTPNAVRALGLVIPLILIMALGLEYLVVMGRRYSKLLVVVLSIVIAFEFIHYLDEYYVHYPQRYENAWEYGFSEMVTKVLKYQNNYQKVVITDKYDQPYILVLFYSRYDPWQYQPQAHLTDRDRFNFGTVRSFDKYEFRTVHKNEVIQSKDTLFVISPEEVPGNGNIIDTVKYPTGRNAFVFVKT